MSGCRVFIGRLNPAAREKDVERFFKGYGRIRDIDLKRGFGFVEFEDPRDADDAVYELDGKELCSERGPGRKELKDTKLGGRWNPDRSKVVLGNIKRRECLDPSIVS
ncbi:serine arginine-rich splicing factor 5 [Limosa lapponica baueri]|uniref:Serine arginine-rich splicing factor 5 n=1 Tax=Limosa lapponica baueri TaxID=1758121 RepID=A0A2I0U3Z8_LIMLA|nr:serine arginine-rich splicing factor 5 [Limosa lapponica baueri]